jgi:MFS family permease
MFKGTDKEVRVERLTKAVQKRISETRRFALLLLGLFGMICGSFGSYTFNLVSGKFQTRYSLSQRDLSAITTCGTVVGYVMLPYSFIYDYIGPLPIAIMSSIVFPLGALLVALCFQGVIVGNVVKLCVFYSFMNVGTSFFDLSSCMTILSYFPVNRGPVVALLKTFIGLGAAIVGCMYQGFFGGAVEHFFYFLMVWAVIVGVLGAIFLRLPDYHLTGYQESHLSAEEKERRAATKTQYLKQKPPMWRFYYGFALMVALIVFLPVTSALTDYLHLGVEKKLAFAIVTTVLTACFFVIAIPSELLICQHRAALHTDEFDAIDDVHDNSRTSSGEEVKQLSVTAVAVDEEEMDTEVDYIAPQYQTSFLRNLLSVNLWALWWTSFCVVGTEGVIMNNASYIFGALSGEKVSDETRVLLTVLSGVGSAAGRLLMSYFEAWSQKRPAEKRIPITVALFFPTTSIIITIVLFLTLPKSVLPLPYVIAAIGNGFLAATTILVTRTIYAKDPAKHYHFCFLATAASSIALNRFLYGEWYTVQAEKLGNSLLCTHRKCVQMPLLVLLGLACSAFISNVVVHFTYRRYCQRILSERRRVRGEKSEDSEPLADGLNEQAA